MLRPSSFGRAPRFTPELNKTMVGLKSPGSPCRLMFTPVLLPSHLHTADIIMTVWALSLRANHSTGFEVSALAVPYMSVGMCMYVCVRMPASSRTALEISDSGGSWNICIVPKAFPTAT